MTIKDLFGPGAVQDLSTLTIDKRGLGLTPGARSAESILTAILLRSLSIGYKPITSTKIVTLTANEQPIEVPPTYLTFAVRSEPDGEAPAATSIANITANGQPIEVSAATTLTATSIANITANKHDLTYRDRDSPDILGELQPQALIYQRSRLEEVKTILYREYLVHDGH